MSANCEASGPILRWAGSKRQILSELRMFLPSDAKRYVEPFCGSACFFFDVQPVAAILGDINAELIGTYRTIRRSTKGVWKHYQAFRPTKNNYYRLRKLSPISLKSEKRAARFLFLNRYCFNGLFRTNKSGMFNVPYGGSTQRILTERHLASAASALRRAQLITGDFQETLSHVRRGDFVYLDPPYALNSRRIFFEYHENTFSTIDLSRLSNELRRIDYVGAWFLLSYADTHDTRRIFSEWFLKRVITRRNIAGFTSSRKRSHELLVANFPLF